ncbi:MAG: hypothetical protein J0M03_22365 [Acidobacteria bacterium]|nr:hypothetical protein [Acidobacteriota bacterium]
MIIPDALERRGEERNLLRLFAKLLVTEEKTTKEVDALVVDTSEFGTGLVTYYDLPVGTNVELVFEDGACLAGQIIDRDYTCPEDVDLIRLGIHFDKHPSTWPIKLTLN